LKDFKILKEFNIKTTFYDPHDLNTLKNKITKKTKLIYVESPGSNSFEFQDLSKIISLAKKYKLSPYQVERTVARIKKIFKLEKPKTFKVSKSLLFLIRAINHMLEINIINGKISTIILGTCKLVRIKGVRRLILIFLKNSISSNKFKTSPNARNIKIAIKIILVNLE